MVVVHLDWQYKERCATSPPATKPMKKGPGVALGEPP